MWEKEYKKKKFYWGLKPSPLLKEIIKYVPKGRALDIGAGEGRNSLFLAKNGFKVTAIDLISEGLKKLKKAAKKRGLKIYTKTINVKKFKFVPSKYSLIILISAIDFLKKSEIEKIIPKIKKSLIPGGAIYFSVFSVKDPQFKKIKKLNLKEVEKKHFLFAQRKFLQTFFY